MRAYEKIENNDPILEGMFGPRTRIAMEVAYLDREALKAALWESRQKIAEQTQEIERLTEELAAERKGQGRRRMN